MPRIHLARPAAHAVRQIECDPADTFVVQFPLHETNVTREDKDLVFAFGDDAVVRLHDFYGVYDAEHMPQFELDGTTVDGKVFLAALLDENLETALGPDSAGHPGFYLDTAVGELMGGLDRLGGLGMRVAGREAPAVPEGMDAQMPADMQQQAVGTAMAAPASPVPEPEPIHEPEPHGPDAGHALSLHANGSMQVMEAGLPQGTAPGTALSATGSMSVLADEGQGSVLSVTIRAANGEAVSVYDAAGGLSDFPTVVTANGTLVCTAFADNVLHYTYTLEHAAAQTTGDGTMARDEFIVTVTGTDGAQAHGSLAVDIVDDAPVLRVEAANGTLVDMGADRLDAAISWGDLEFVDGNGRHFEQVYAHGEPVTLQTLALGTVVGQTSQGPAFVLAANPADGSYVFEQYAELDSVGARSHALAECHMEPVASGAYGEGILCTGDGVAVAIHAAGGEKLNVSGQGIGVHNNWLNPGETMIFDMTGGEPVVDFSFGYAGTGNKPGIADVMVTFRDGSAFHFVTGAQPSAGPFVLSGQEGYPAGREIASVAVTGVENGKLALGSVYSDTAEQQCDVSLKAHFCAIDGDGDQVDGDLSLALNECITPVAEGLLPSLMTSGDAPQAILTSLQSVLQDEQLASLPLGVAEAGSPSQVEQGLSLQSAAQDGAGAAPMPQPTLAMGTEELDARFGALLESGDTHDLRRGLSSPSTATVKPGDSLMDCDSLAATLGIDPHSGSYDVAGMIPQPCAVLQGTPESLLSQLVDEDQNAFMEAALRAQEARQMVELSVNA